MWLQAYSFFVSVPDGYAASAGEHLFFSPSINLDCGPAAPVPQEQCGFLWVSAPFPVSAANRVGRALLAADFSKLRGQHHCMQPWGIGSVPAKTAWIQCEMQFADRRQQNMFP